MSWDIKGLVQKEFEQVRESVRECLLYVEEVERVDYCEEDLIVFAAFANEEIIGTLARRFGLIEVVYDRLLYHQHLDLIREGILVSIEGSEMVHVPSPAFISGVGHELWAIFLSKLDEITVEDVLSLEHLPIIFRIEICHQSGLMGEPC